MEDLFTRVEHYFTKRRVAFTTKRMMGVRVFMVNEKMCVGIEDTGLLVRLDPAEVTAAVEKGEARATKIAGRTLKGFVVVESDELRRAEKLAAWIARALAYNPKAKAAKKRSKAKR